MRLPTFYEQNLIPNWGIYIIRCKKNAIKKVGNITVTNLSENLESY